jgi:hypothetical protein
MHLFLRTRYTNKKRRNKQPGFVLFFCCIFVNFNFLTTLSTTDCLRVDGSLPLLFATKGLCNLLHFLNLTSIASLPMEYAPGRWRECALLNLLSPLNPLWSNSYFNLRTQVFIFIYVSVSSDAMNATSKKSLHKSSYFCALGLPLKSS